MMKVRGYKLGPHYKSLKFSLSKMDSGLALV